LEHAEDAEELIAVGRFHLDGRDQRLALACFERAVELSRSRAARQAALVALAHARRRAGNRVGALRVWERFCQEFPEQNLGFEEQAKYFEHVAKDLPQALALAKAAPQSYQQPLQQRVARLARRISAGGHRTSR
jgi:tetratricopeptide (TPR) repeat protein